PSPEPLPVPQPLTTRARDAVPAIAASVAAVRREVLTVTPLCAWMEEIRGWERSQAAVLGALPRIAPDGTGPRAPCQWERSHAPPPALPRRRAPSAPPPSAPSLAPCAQMGASSRQTRAERPRSARWRQRREGSGSAVGTAP